MASASDMVFVKEIQMMMFGLGDCESPLLSTASIIESVVRQQLTILLIKISEVSKSRGATHIEVQDILFTFRKDKLKLKRVIQFMEMKDTKMGINKIMEEMDPFAGLSLQQNRQRSRKDGAVRFLSTIGIEDGSLDDILDGTKMYRLKRANEMALTLSDKSYFEFHKSRTCSFIGTQMNQSKLLEWLKVTAGECVGKLKKDTIDVLVYLAKEVVAELIDHALLVRQDTIAVPGDPLSRADDPLPSSHHDTYGPKQNKMEGPGPITPDEIREVVRRFMSNILLPFGSFNCNSFNPANHRLLVE